MKILEVKNLTKNFGGLSAVSDLEMDIKRGEILGLIGPNGAGKTTVFNMLSGFIRPNKGTIIYKELKNLHLKQPQMLEFFIFAAILGVKPI